MGRVTKLRGNQYNLGRFFGKKLYFALKLRCLVELAACCSQYASQVACLILNLARHPATKSIFASMLNAVARHSDCWNEKRNRTNDGFLVNFLGIVALAICFTALIPTLSFAQINADEFEVPNFEIPSAEELQLEFGDLGPSTNGEFLVDPNSDINPYADDSALTGVSSAQNEISPEAFEQILQDLPVRIYLDDNLLTETGEITPPVPNVAVAVQAEPELSTDVMDVHLSINRDRAKRRMSVELIRDEESGVLNYQPDMIHFKANWNYERFVSKAEIRLYKAGELGRGKPIKILPISNRGFAKWRIPERFAQKMEFALRLYGKDGGFDQSRLTTFDATGLVSTDGVLISGSTPPPRFSAQVETGYAETGIELYGAQVRFSIDNVPTGHEVFVMGQTVDDLGSRASVDLILPPGKHRVQVSVRDKFGDGIAFERTAIVPENDFFYAALGELTIGANTGKSYADYYQQTGNSGEIDLFESAGIEGQASMFFKGRLLGKYILTAALDTGEGELDSLLENLVSRDPNSILSKIDPEETYSVYGDHSYTQNEAPTQEKLFIKLERNGSHILWGSFKTSYRGNTFATIERSVYGAEIRLNKTFQTDSGSAELDASGFALPPGQLQQRDSLRGNNGFVYALSNKNILSGSEIIRVEVRHPISNIVVEQSDLIYGVDYDIDYLQGQVVLANSLPSTRGFGSSATDEHPVFLVVVYEFTPLTTSAEQYVVGGRSELKVGDFISVGATGLVDSSGPVAQSMVGLDAQVNIGASSYVKAQVSNTKTIASGKQLNTAKRN